MKKLTTPPSEWNCGIVTADIRKRGEPRRDMFELVLDGAVEYWGQDYAPRRPLRASVTAGWAGGVIVAAVDIDGEFIIPCYRCLDETGVAIKGNMRYIFSLRQPEENSENKSGDAGADGGKPDGSVDVIRIEPFKGEIDMSPYIWETMVLNLPERALCKEECAGLCPVCGANRNTGGCGCAENNTDPRFEALKSLL